MPRSVSKGGWSRHLKRHGLERHGHNCVDGDITSNSRQG